MFLSAAIITYLSFFNQEVRRKLIDKWFIHINERSIPITKPYNMIKILSNDI